MPYVISRVYSWLDDHPTGVALRPVVDPRSGYYVGAAWIEEKQTPLFAQRRGFEVLSGEEYEALVGTRPALDDDQVDQAGAELLAGAPAAPNQARLPAAPHGEAPHGGDLPDQAGRGGRPAVG